MIDSNRTSTAVGPEIRGRRILITGAGSGTGAAAAELLARTHAVVLVGRREGMLRATADRILAAGGDATVVPFDLTARPAAELLAAADSAVRAANPTASASGAPNEITDLVLAAGLNAPRRAWGDHDLGEFDRIVETNLTSVAHLITAALPGLRRHAGTVVVVSSKAAVTRSPGSGVAYRASKTALRALTESLNDEEAAHGVRACHLCPGDIDTDFLLQRPDVPSGTAREVMLSPADVARTIAFVLDSPPHVRIDELVVTPVGTVGR